MVGSGSTRPISGGGADSRWPLAAGRREDPRQRSLQEV